jgi:hypothetical protein
VLTVGYPALQLPGEGLPGGQVVEGSSTDLGRLTDAVLSGIEDRGSVVAIFPSWAAEPAQRNLETVRSALTTDELAMRPTSLPPLAGGVLGSLVSGLATRVASPGALLAAIAGVESRLLWVAWLNSVSRLATPPPTIGQHLASYLPGSGFAVCSWSDPPIRRLRRGRDGIPRPAVGARRMGLIVAGRGENADWVQRVVVPAVGRPQVTAVDPPPLGPLRWGTANAVEAVAYPLDLSDLEGDVPAWPRSPCSWCGHEVSHRSCPFCWMTGTDDVIGGPTA